MNFTFYHTNQAFDMTESGGFGRSLDVSLVHDKVYVTMTEGPEGIQMPMTKADFKALVKRMVAFQKEYVND